MPDARREARVSKQDWEVLYREYFPKVRGFFVFRRLDPAEADDLAQEVFKELMRGKMPEEPNTYIHAIARNILARHRRRKMIERAALSEYRREVTANSERPRSHDSDAGSSDEDSHAEAERILKIIRDRLPAQHAELVMLRFLQGLSVKQVAQRMGCSEDAIQKRIHRLRVILRQLNERVRQCSRH